MEVEFELKFWNVVGVIWGVKIISVISRLGRRELKDISERISSDVGKGGKVIRN